MTNEEKTAQIDRMIAKLKRLGLVSTEENQCNPQADFLIHHSSDSKQLSTFPQS